MLMNEKYPKLGTMVPDKILRQILFTGTVCPKNVLGKNTKVHAHKDK